MLLCQKKNIVVLLSKKKPLKNFLADLKSVILKLKAKVFIAMNVFCNVVEFIYYETFNI